MAFLSPRDIVLMEDRYGQPRTFRRDWEIEPGAFQMVRNSQKHGRAHDVTMFIFNDDDKLVLIRKHMNPPGAFRAPSGGVNPGESMQDGALREALEETGLIIKLQRYIARFLMTFTTENGKRLEWRSDVFIARALSGEMVTQDTREIAEVQAFSVEELQGPIRELMLGTGARLLEYRVFLTDKVIELINENIRD